MIDVINKYNSDKDFNTIYTLGNKYIDDYNKL